MPTDQSPTRLRTLRLWLGSLLLATALGVSCFMAATSFTGDVILGCGAASSCSKVLHTQWAYWLGLPVSLPAAALDLTLLVLLWLTRVHAPRLRRIALLLTVAGAVALLGAAVWFIGLQLLAIGEICPWCMGAHTTGTLAAAVILWDTMATSARGRYAGDELPPPETTLSEPEPPEGLTHRDFGAAIGVGALALGVLLGGQWLLIPPQYRTVATSGVTGTHTITVLRKFQVDTHEVPTIGAPDAPGVAIVLYDYRCHFCRDLHARLLKVAKRSALNGKLVIVTLPMPLDSVCNHYVQQTYPAHKDSCAFARLGLALWHADPQAFRLFDQWAYADDRWTRAEEPYPSLDDARDYAEKLLGSNGAARLEVALNDPWVERQLQMDIEIYAENSRAMHDWSLPQMIVGYRSLVGVVPTEDELAQLLTNAIPSSPSR